MLLMVNKNEINVLYQFKIVMLIFIVQKTTSNVNHIKLRQFFGMMSSKYCKNI